jgi:hypothetical protein
MKRLAIIPIILLTGCKFWPGGGKEVLFNPGPTVATNATVAAPSVNMMPATNVSPVLAKMPPKPLFVVPKAKTITLAWTWKPDASNPWSNVYFPVMHTTNGIAWSLATNVYSTNIVTLPAAQAQEFFMLTQTVNFVTGMTSQAVYRCTNYSRIVE